MTQVDFHILKQNGLSAMFSHACRLVEKGRRSGRSIYIHTANREEAELIDNQLWGFRPEAFIPHGIQGETTDKVPVLIGWGEDPGLQHDVLINLDGKNTPGFFSRFEKLFEIVPNDPAIKDAAREKWRYYQHRGYPLAKHDIDSKA